MKKFSFFDFVIIFAITVLLTTVATLTYIDYTSNSNKNASIKNHWVVIKFIKKSLDDCKTGNELILKQNSKINTENLCPLILSGNAIKMQSAFINHFKELKLCNTYGLKNTSDNCKKAIVGGITNEKGNVGETVLSASGAILTIHTKITSKENITNNIILIMK